MWCHKKKKEKKKKEKKKRKIKNWYTIVSFVSNDQKLLFSNLTFFCYNLHKI